MPKSLHTAQNRLPVESPVAFLARLWPTEGVMCGRYSFHLTEAEVSELAGSAPESLPAAVFNQPPGVPVPVLGPEENWDRLPWGAELPVAAGGKRFVINARSETVSGKRMFQGAFAKRRCLLPASGFFEWQRKWEPSQPFYFHPRSAPGILLAGLILMGGQDAKPAVVVLTRQADEWMSEIHHRAPVLIRPERLRLWLDASVAGETALRDSVFPSEAAVLERHPVALRVNRVAENDPGVILPIEMESVPEQGELFA